LEKDQEFVAKVADNEDETIRDSITKAKMADDSANLTIATSCWKIAETIWIYNITSMTM